MPTKPTTTEKRHAVFSKYFKSAILRMLLGCFVENVAKFPSWLDRDIPFDNLQQEFNDWLPIRLFESFYKEAAMETTAKILKFDRHVKHWPRLPTPITPRDLKLVKKDVFLNALVQLEKREELKSITMRIREGCKRHGLRGKPQQQEIAGDFLEEVIHY